MRKQFLIILAAFLILCCHTTIYAESEGIDTVKVGLFYGSTAKSSVEITSADGFLMGFEEDGEFVEDGILEESSVTVCAGDGNTVEVGSYIYDADVFPTLYPVEGTIKVDGVEYRGGVQFKRIDGGNLTVINVVNMEEYLYSVIGKEMSPSWNIEALKAQAVCARGFAISNRNKFEKYGFNLDTTTTSQVYKGVSVETESTRRAAEETAGQVLLCDGEIIQSIYCASMGGASANAKDVWGGSYPYLVSVIDPYENPDEATRYSWSITLTADDIEDCLADSGVDIGDILDVEIVDQDAAGYVLELKFTGTDGTHTVKRSSCRGIFGGKIHSQRYNIITNEEDEEIKNNLIRHIPSAREFPFFATAENIENPKKIKATSISKVTFKPYTPQKKTNTRKPVADGEYIFEGHGWGHGVGMSQWGAKAMADQGFTYEDILTFYYTGTYLETVYSPEEIVEDITDIEE